MQKFSFIGILSGFTKVMIFPLFFLGTFLAALITINIAAGSFSNNYGEAIEGIAFGVIFLAPALLLITISITLLGLKLKHAMHLLKNDWFLAFWGMGSAMTCVILLLALEWLIKFI